MIEPVFLIVMWELIGYLVCRQAITEFAQEEGNEHSPLTLLLASLWVMFIWPWVIIKAFHIHVEKKVECNCHSSMFDDNGKTVHYSDCAVIQEQMEDPW